MLSKQAWRLWERLESLCARILQAKYYNNSTVLDAKPKAAMSYMWRSILRGVQLLKKGMIWRVGDGRGSKIWSDPWLPRDQSRRPITPGGTSLVTNVDELIKELLRSCSGNKISKSSWQFQCLKAKTIFWLGISTSMGDSAFEVPTKFARMILSRNQNHRAAQGGSRQQEEPVWKKIWSLNCPNK